MVIVQQAEREIPGLSSPTEDPDRAALAALMIEHSAMIWRYLRLVGADSHEADDLMQDTFVLMAERLRGGDQPREPAAFLRGVARNLLLNARRRVRSRPPTVQWIDAVDQYLLAEPGVLENRRLTWLRECLGRLGGRMREAVEHHHVEGVPCLEVARRMGLGQNGVKSLLARARQALRDCVQSKMQEESSS